MRGRVAHAPTETKSASLAEEFGYNYAVRLFGQQAIDSLPLLLSGKNKGKPKGHVIWLKTTGKGYHPMANGGVGAGAILWAWIGDTSSMPRESATRGFWMGGWQNLSGNYGLLSDAARRRDIAQRLRDRNEEADDDRHGRVGETFDQIISRLTVSAELRAKWAAEDRVARAFPGDPQRLAFQRKIDTLRTFGPHL